MNKRLRWSHPLNEVFSEGIVTDSRLKYDILCKFTNDSIDNLSVKVCPSTRCTDKSIAETTQSPSPPPLQEVTSEDNDSSIDSLTPQPIIKPAILHLMPNSSPPLPCKATPLEPATKKESEYVRVKKKTFSEIKKKLENLI